MKQVNLRTTKDVKRMLSRVANDVLAGTIDPARGNCAVHACNILLKAIQGDIEGRVEELEKVVNEKLRRRA